MQLLTQDYIHSIIRPRRVDSHKGAHGHAFLVAGRSGSMGAALIAARACLRMGAGLLTVLVPFGERTILQNGLPEAMLSFAEDGFEDADKYAALGIGPAIGTDTNASKLFSCVTAASKAPSIVDADGITLLARHKVLWENIQPGTIITPHPKEFDRIAGDCTDHNQRLTKAIALAAERKLIIVLKGHETIITDGSGKFQNTTGNAGLAKGGSGDMLTGMITGLLAQRYPPIQAACIAVYMHGLAADICLTKQSMESMLATDVIECLGDAWRAILNVEY